MQRLLTAAISLGLCLLVLPPAAVAQQNWNPAARAAEVAPLLSDQTMIVVHVDAALDVEHLGSKLAPLIGDEQSRQQFQQQVQKFIEAQRELRAAGLKDIYIVADLGSQQDDMVAVAFAGERDKLGVLEEKVRSQLPEGRGLAAIGELLVTGSSQTRKRLEQNAPVARPDIEAALAKCSPSDVQLLFVPSSDLRRVIRELLQLPEHWGSIRGSTLTEGVHWGIASMQVKPEFRVEILTQAANAEAARNLAAALPPVLNMARQQPLPDSLRDVLARLASPTQNGDQLRWTFADNGRASGTSLLAGLLGPVEAARSAAQRGNCTNQLKQLGIAMHNYHEVYKHFPDAANRDADGRPLLSWRVHLLPFLEQQKLYESFHLDEPWDSEHNKQFIEKMPVIYACPAARLQPGHTTYLLPGGPAGLYGDGKGPTFRDITDGTSNTLMIVDAAEGNATIWTKPGDFEVNPENAAQKLSGNHAKGFVAALCDGSVRFISVNVNAETLLRLFNPRDGKPIGGDF